LLKPAVEEDITRDDQRPSLRLIERLRSVPYTPEKVKTAAGAA
jgi:hypothetical protein